MMREVKKRVTHVALVFEVHGEIEKIILILVVTVESLQEHGLTVLVGDVFYHYCGPQIEALGNALKVEHETGLESLL